MAEGNPAEAALVGALKKRYTRTPFGTMAEVTAEDPTGEGDRVSLSGNKIIIPSKDPASLPHEAMHAGLRHMEMAAGGPLGPLAEGLISAGAEKIYGNQSQYLNPFERIAYGYQEGVTGQPDQNYQDAVKANPYSFAPGSPRTYANLVGKLAEVFGRGLGKVQR